MTTAQIIGLAALALLILIAILLYNRLVRLRVQVKTGWAQIDAQLRRRHDLVPNLVAAVRGYFGHESKVLETVAAVRERAVNAGDSPAQRSAAEQALGAALGRLIARVEAMPELKADGTVLMLQEELATTENRITFSRQHYNETVGRYNGTIESIPDMLIAKPCGFTPAQFLELDAPVAPPVVDLEKAA